MRVDFLCLPVLLAPIPISAQSIWYVDATAQGSHVGTSWQDAFVDLQQALIIATSGDAVWIAGGVYRPDGGTFDKSLSFRVPSGVALHGGFAGDETVLSQRDILTHPTILTGDLLGDDQPPFGNQADNSHQVLRLIAGQGLSVLSGLTVTRGRYPLFGNEAAGLQLEVGVNALIELCTIRDNIGLNFGPGGVGISVAVAGPATAIIRNSVFINNRSNSAQGGAAWIDGDASVQIVNCGFFGNHGSLNGGALHCGGGTEVSVVNCVFSGNKGGSFGSAIASLGSLLVTNSTFSRNATTSAHGAGGAVYGSDGSMAVVNCVFSENTAASDSPGHVDAHPDVSLSASYCCMFPQEDPSIGEHHIFGDPLFTDLDGPDGVIGTEDDDLHLLPMSPCIDAGDANAVGPDVGDLDSDGNTSEAVPVDSAQTPRLIDRPEVDNTGVGAVPVDMGAYEVSNWTYLGHGLEGTQGVPWLEGGGDWFAGQQVSIKVSNARRSTFAALIFGGGVQLAPFKGGTLVPTPEIALIVRTSPAGEFILSDRLPNRVSPGQVVLQVWIVDPEGPLGAAATAAYVGTLK